MRTISNFNVTAFTINWYENNGRINIQRPNYDADLTYCRLQLQPNNPVSCTYFNCDGQLL
jgi:hypothetical protein